MANLKKACELLPVLYVRAKNNYEAGKAIGSSFKGWITEYMQTAKDVKLFRSFYQTKNGRAIYKGYLDSAQKCHPQIVSEIRGMADGAGQSFEDIFLLQIASEILYCHSNSVEMDDENQQPLNSGKGCTDILLNKEGCRLIGHNDDWDDDVSDLSYFVHVTIDDNDDTSDNETEDNLTGKEEIGNQSPPQQFVSYLYPGYLAGFTFGMNKNLVITLNTLVPPQAAQGSVPLLILLRALLGCDTIEECVAVMKNEPVGCAYGMNINIANIEGDHMCSLEVYPHPSGTKVHVHHVPYGGNGTQPCYYFHQNHYKHMEAEELEPLTGSKLREKRTNEMDPPQSARDVKRILGDTKDPIEPVYLVPSDAHYEPHIRTSATAIFNLTERRLEIYRSNPKLANHPCVVMPFL